MYEYTSVNDLILLIDSGDEEATQEAYDRISAAQSLIKKGFIDKDQVEANINLLLDAIVRKEVIR